VYRERSNGEGQFDSWETAGFLNAIDGREVLVRLWNDRLRGREKQREKCDGGQVNWKKIIHTNCKGQCDSHSNNNNNVEWRILGARGRLQKGGERERGREGGHFEHPPSQGGFFSAIIRGRRKNAVPSSKTTLERKRKKGKKESNGKPRGESKLEKEIHLRRKHSR